jgi:hypothetical protein
MLKHINKRTLAAATVIITAGLPAVAVATPDGVPPGAPSTASPPPVEIVATPAMNADPGFQWGDAGLGAAGMALLVGVGSGAAVVARRRGGRALMG